MNEDEAGFRMRESKYNLRYEHNIILMSESTKEPKRILKLMEQPALLGL